MVYNNNNNNNTCSNNNNYNNNNKHLAGEETFQKLSTSAIMHLVERLQT